MGVATFIVNQNIRLEQLKDLVDKQSNDIVIVTSHTLFPLEEVFLKQGFKHDLTCLPISGFFAEQEQEQIDNRIWDEVAPEWRSTGMPQYATCRSLRLFYKSAELSKKIQAQFNPESCYVISGLGIDIGGIAKHLPVEVIGSVDGQVENDTVAPYLKSKFKSIFSSKVSKVTIAGKNWFFVGNANRLKNRITDWQFTELSNSINFKLAWAARKTLRCLPNTILMPMHQYNHLKNKKVYILQDGYLPSNYTPTLLFSYAPDDVIVASNPFSAKWCNNSSFATCVLPGFFDARMAHPKNIRKAESVLFAFQHAGDWSAQINRSDTDNLILFAVNEARGNPGKKMCLRLHPTMIHPEHEGKYSFERVVSFIEKLKLPNLSISKAPLHEDLASADVVISEYSQVLIDAWAQGIIGIIVNPTSRRSFMQDYIDLGFPYMGKGETLMDMLENISHIVQMQADAVDRFNKCMSEFIV